MVASISVALRLAFSSLANICRKVCCFVPAMRSSPSPTGIRGIPRSINLSPAICYEFAPEFTEGCRFPRSPRHIGRLQAARVVPKFAWEVEHGDRSQDPPGRGLSARSALAPRDRASPYRRRRKPHSHRLARARDRLPDRRVSIGCYGIPLYAKGRRQMTTVIDLNAECAKLTMLKNRTP